MGLFDRVKEVASDAIDKGQEVAKTQQLKLELKRLEGALEDAYAAYGRRAFAHHQAGTPAPGLEAEAQAIRDAQSALDARRAEVEPGGEPAPGGPTGASPSGAGPTGAGPAGGGDAPVGGGTSAF